MRGAAGLVKVKKGKERVAENESWDRSGDGIELGLSKGSLEEMLKLEFEADEVRLKNKKEGQRKRQEGLEQKKKARSKERSCK